MGFFGLFGKKKDTSDNSVDDLKLPELNSPKEPVKNDLSIDKLPPLEEPKVDQSQQISNAVENSMQIPPPPKSQEPVKEEENQHITLDHDKNDLNIENDSSNDELKLPEEFPKEEPLNESAPIDLTKDEFVAPEDIPRKEDFTIDVEESEPSLEEKKIDIDIKPEKPEEEVNVNLEKNKSVDVESLKTKEDSQNLFDDLPEFTHEESSDETIQAPEMEHISNVIPDELFVERNSYINSLHYLKDIKIMLDKNSTKVTSLNSYNTKFIKTLKKANDLLEGSHEGLIKVEEKLSR